MSLLAVSGAGAKENEQLDLGIIHQSPGCIRSDVFPVIRAEVADLVEIRTAKVYFRSELYPDFYYVEMTLTEGRFEAVLPMPNSDTSKVIYYIEVVDSSFNGTRTIEHAPNVSNSCGKDPAFIFTGGNPGIIIGALDAGASAIPPGFQAAGIAGAAVGSGIGATTVVAVAAGAAGAAGVGVVAIGGEATTSVTPTITVPSGGATTTVPGITTTSAPATTSVPGGSTTTTSILGSPTTTTSTPTSLAACFTTTVLNSCFLKFDARCSTGDIVSRRWELDTTGLVGGPFIHVTPADVYNYDFGTCSGQTITVRLTVTDRNNQTDSVTDTVTLPSTLRILQSEASGQLRMSFTSTLSSIPSAQVVQGRVVINDRRQDVTDSSGEYRHQIAGNHGKNTIEAYTSSAFHGDGYWLFDFSGAAHFVPGSLQVEQGQAVSVGGGSVIFRLTRRAGRMRFSFRLE